jgi:hypothetical protein
MQMNTEVAEVVTTNVDGLIEKYAQEFFDFCKKTIESQLNMGRVIYECSTNLSNENDFSKFCEMIGIDKHSSTLRKYKAIGKHFDFLYSNRDKLPSNWTTLYEIARLDEERIESLMTRGLLSHKTTGAELKTVISSEKTKNITQPTNDDSDIIEGEVVQNGTDEEVFCTLFIGAAVSDNQELVLELIKLTDDAKSLGVKCVITDKFTSQVS